ncbi:LAQU0S07e05138g1_1 [Lachancea quebecensis]|uniref:LAQU0S07e05138g1_1 n=1 Tax=Lachancea quebecensis TaxID=1654605 RepID=A0A0P1KT84_9SACH|nr:LAQU0S07e05138g1_1 [Lachancea quebecensis]
MVFLVFACILDMARVAGRRSCKYSENSVTCSKHVVVYSRVLPRVRRRPRRSERLAQSSSICTVDTAVPAASHAMQMYGPVWRRNSKTLRFLTASLAHSRAHKSAPSHIHVLTLPRPHTSTSSHTFVFLCSWRQSTTLLQCRPSAAILQTSTHTHIYVCAYVPRLNCTERSAHAPITAWKSPRRHTLNPENSGSPSPPLGEGNRNISRSAGAAGTSSLASTRSHRCPR